jgi:DNA polymerase family A
VRKFGTVVVADNEYETSGGEYNLRPGDLPVPLCMVTYVLNENLQHVRTFKMWRDELLAATRAPFDVGPDALFVAYSAQAELTCFHVLGWRFPTHVFDLHTAYLAASNVLPPCDEETARTKPRKRLSDACRAYGIEGWEQIDKEAIAKAIGEGHWRDYGRERVTDYCEEDVRKTTELLRAMVRGQPALEIARVLHWSNYSAKTVAQIQCKGIPIDTALWDLVQHNQAAVIRKLLEQFDPSYGESGAIYSLDGEWSYERFERWLVRSGIPAWPRLESGRLDTDSDAFRLMYTYPGIEGLHALRDSIGFIAKARLPIGRDGRNRPSLFPFCTTTGRNAHARSPYNAHAGVRGFMVFPPGTIGAYLDWRTQEVGIAAAHSADHALMADYSGGDVYHALARVCGITTDPDPVHWKKHNLDTRHRMKCLQLGISYGMTVPGLARGLNRHPLIASGIIERHKRTYPRFWEWRSARVMTAMFERRIESVFGWPLHITTSPNQRSLYNFPMQSGGAEMLRLAAWRLCEAGIVPAMLVHDGILLELDSLEQVEHAKEIMRAAGRDVCDGFEIGVDTDQLLIDGARYIDKRPRPARCGARSWARWRASALCHGGPPNGQHQLYSPARAVDRGSDPRDCSTQNQKAQGRAVPCVDASRRGARLHGGQKFAASLGLVRPVVSVLGRQG